MPWELTGNATEPNDFLGTTNNQPIAIRTNNTERMRVGANGNVGIGTANPDARLHVLGWPGFAAVVATFEQPAGAMNFVELRSSQGGGNYGSDIRFVDSGVINAEIKSTANSQLRFATTSASVDRVTIDSNGNVGIGTANPASPLHILGPQLEPPAGLPAPQNGLMLGLQSTAGYKWIQSYGGALALNPMGNNVGIGTEAPATTLDVNGTATVRVLQIIGGSDLAERFPVEGDAIIEPGTVMVIDDGHPGKVRVSDTAYDRKLAGIVSGAGGAHPGVVLQQELPPAAEIPVALTGRVYCKAEAVAHPIEPGDMLTTSDIPGHAMKAVNASAAQGAILGKAMTPLKEGKGLVLVLVNLQ